MKKTLLPLLLLTFASCGNPELEKKVEQLQARIDSFQTANTALVKELDGYKYAPEKLLVSAQKAFEKRSRTSVEEIYQQLFTYHPESKEFEAVKGMIDQFNAEDIAKAQQLEKEKEAEKAKRMKAVSKLKKKFDDVTGITWYYNPYFTHYNNSNHTSLYIGKEGSRAWLRLVMSYEGGDWIFFKHAYLSYDGNTYTVPFDEYRERKSDNGGYSVWEWLDVSVDESLLAFLKDMVNGKSLKMRLSGKYTHTKTLSSTEKKALQDVLMAYDVLRYGE